MQEQAQSELEDPLGRTLDRVGLVGARLREELARDLKTKLVDPEGGTPVEIVGSAGTGKHRVSEAAHQAAREVLGRSDRRVELDCAACADEGDFEGRLREVLPRAQGGTLVLDRYGAMAEDQRAAATRVLDREGADTLLVTLREEDGSETSQSPEAAGRIHLAPLYRREEDIWELIDHFFEQTEASSRCRGFSRQAKADVAQIVRETNLGSVRRLRNIVRNLVYEALPSSSPPLKITSDLVRPYLEEHFGQTANDRAEREAELMDSQFDSVFNETLLDRLAELHGVPRHVLERQAEVLDEIVRCIDGVPQSYRNIMDKTDDVMRASLWLLTGAETQAEFRRWFGEERFMRPTKSVAWAFYNRVFKRDV